MAYPGNTNDNPLEYLRMGGLNQRISPHALPSPLFSVLQGLYSARDGALERLPGIKSLGIAGNGSAAIWNIWQPNDGTDNIFIQTSDGTERAYTLNELFGRTVTQNLIYIPQPDDEAMPTATIIQDAANVTNGPSIGASPNTWYQRELTSNPLNEDSIVVSFTSGASAQWTLAPGTYRIRGFVSAKLQMSSTGNNLGAPTMTFQAALSNISDSTTEITGSPAVFYFQRLSPSTMNALISSTVYSYFDDTVIVSGSNKDFAVYNAYSSSGTNTTFSALTGEAAGVNAALNGAALREPYLKLTISKVA